MGDIFRQSATNDRGGWRPAAVGAVVAIQGAHLLWTLAPPMEGAARHWVANLFIDSSVVFALALVLVVARRYRGSRLGLAWTLIALGLALNVFAEVSWSVQEMMIDAEVPFPSISDIGYAGAYLPTLLGLLLMPQAPFSPMSRAKLGLDSLIVTSALAVLSWALIVGRILGHAGESAQAQAVSAFYPLADIAVIFAAFVLVVRAGRTKFALAFGLLAAGYVATAFSDSAYAYLTEAGYSTGNYADIGWVAGYSLLSLAALAALDPVATFEPLTRRDEQAPAFWPSLAPYAAMLPIAALLLGGAVRGNVDPALTAGFLAVTALVVLRQIVANFENTRLNHELRDLTANLEMRVREKTMQLLQRRPQSIEEGAPAGDRPNGADEPVGGLRQE